VGTITPGSSPRKTPGLEVILDSAENPEKSQERGSTIDSPAGLSPYSAKHRIGEREGEGGGETWEVLFTATLWCCIS